MGKSEKIETNIFRIYIQQLILWKTLGNGGCATLKLGFGVLLDFLRSSLRSWYAGDGNGPAKRDTAGSRR